jgi:hypothetical protein
VRAGPFVPQCPWGANLCNAAPEFAVSTLGSLLLSSLVEVTEIKVLASGALTSALNELAPQYERTTGYEVLKGNPVDEVHVAPSPTAYDSTFMPMKSA